MMVINKACLRSYQIIAYGKLLIGLGKTKKNNNNEVIFHKAKLIQLK